MQLQKIKEQATKLFAERGYYGASVKDITEAVGITAPALYAHFNSKEELFITLFDESYTALMTGAEDIIDKNSEKACDDILKLIFKYYMNFFMKHSYKTLFILHNWLFPPVGLKLKILSLINERGAKVAGFVRTAFEECINADAVKKSGIKKHTGGFYRFVHSYVFEIATLEKDISEEELEEIWQVYWEKYRN